MINFLNIDGEMVSDEGDIARHFNEYFASVADNLDAQIETSNICPLAYVNVNVASSLFLFPVTTDECISIVSNLKNTKYNQSSIPVFLIKDVIHELPPYIVQLINNSFTAGIFPECLKNDTVTPIYKKVDKSFTSNYHPISVLPFMNKIFERCVATRLWRFFNEHNIISLNQFGIRRGCSTIDALIKLTEFFYSSLNNSNHLVSIFVDLRKAFDTVNHEILLRKLHCYGIRELALDWFKSYLCNRKQCVKIGTQLSE